MNERNERNDERGGGHRHLRGRVVAVGDERGRAGGGGVDRLSSRDRLNLRIQQINSTLPESRAKVRAMIRHGKVYAELLRDRDRVTTIESLASELSSASDGVGYEPWYIRMCLAFYDANEQPDGVCRQRLGQFTMFGATLACGMRDDNGKLLPAYDPEKFASFDAAMEQGAAA